MPIASIAKINASNESVAYLAKRLESDDYRGMHLSQHNRYDFDRFETMFDLLQKHSRGKIMRIRTQDTSKRPANLPEELKYAAYCDEVKRKIGVGTQDAMRKNFFVDFSRMGMLDRFNEKGSLIPTEGKSAVKSVALSELGKKFVSAPALERRYLYSAAVDRLLGGVIDIVLDIANRLNTRKFDTFEFMFFISAVGAGTDIEVTREEAARLVTSYRALSRTQRQALIDAVQSYADPRKFAHLPKTEKRDFGNWKNETDQLLSVLDQTVYFEHRASESALVLTSDRNSPVNQVRMQRSKKEKDKYFEQHGVGREAGFELHHVVSLGSSVSLDHFLMLDCWKNMVYIDGYSHAKITQAKNLHVLMTNNAATIVLSKIGANPEPISLHRPNNVRYSDAKLPTMLQYNARLNSI